MQFGIRKSKVLGMGKKKKHLWKNENPGDVPVPALTT